MPEQITKRDLEAVTRRINSMMGTNDDTFYWLSGAYGGYALYQKSGAGASDVLMCGHRPKRELYNLMQAFIRGIDAERYARASAAA